MNAILNKQLKIILLGLIAVNLLMGIVFARRFFKGYQKNTAPTGKIHYYLNRDQYYASLPPIVQTLFF